MNGWNKRLHRVTIWSRLNQMIFSRGKRWWPRLIVKTRNSNVWWRYYSRENWWNGWLLIREWCRERWWPIRIALRS